MQSKRYSPKSFDGGIAAAFGALPRGGRRARDHDHHQPQQRDWLYEPIRNHLGSVGDPWDALERDKDFAKAARLGVQFSEEFELLEDIGGARTRVARASS